MAEFLPVRKYVKVWIKKRKNNTRFEGKPATVSCTLEWLEFGPWRFFSMDKHATLGFTRQTAVQQERELNSPEQSEVLDPVLWDDFLKKYKGTIYPGHALPPQERKVAARRWGKGRATMLRERSSLEHFGRLIKPRWCHEITDKDRIRFMQEAAGVFSVRQRGRCLPRSHPARWPVIAPV